MKLFNMKTNSEYEFKTNGDAVNILIELYSSTDVVSMDELLSSIYIEGSTFENVKEIFAAMREYEREFLNSIDSMIEMVLKIKRRI